MRLHLVRADEMPADDRPPSSQHAPERHSSDRVTLSYDQRLQAATRAARMVSATLARRGG